MPSCACRLQSDAKPRVSKWRPWHNLKRCSRRRARHQNAFFGEIAGARPALRRKCRHHLYRQSRRFFCAAASGHVVPARRPHRGLRDGIMRPFGLSGYRQRRLARVVQLTLVLIKLLRNRAARPSYTQYTVVRAAASINARRKSRGAQKEISVMAGHSISRAWRHRHRAEATSIGSFCAGSPMAASRKRQNQPYRRNRQRVPGVKDARRRQKSDYSRLDRNRHQHLLRACGDPFRGVIIGGDRGGGCSQNRGGIMAAASPSRVDGSGAARLRAGGGEIRRLAGAVGSGDKHVSARMML